MSKRFPKIYKEAPLKPGPHGHRVPLIHIEPGRRVSEIRKATNEEILRDTIAKRGYVKLNVSLCIQYGDGYAGYQGASTTIIVPTLELAEEFPERLREAIKKLAAVMGLEVSAKVKL
jgi:hypothetical protein